MQALNTKNIEKIRSIFSDDPIYHQQNYAPAIGDAGLELIKTFFDASESIVVFRKLRSTRVHVSDSSDIANLWAIVDNYLDDTARR